MSWQAHRAVTFNSRQTKHLRLMNFLAEHANENLILDPAPNQDTIAAFFGVSSRTIREWIKRLIADGELKQLRVGSGPGKPSAYQITLEIPEGSSVKAEVKAEKAEANPIDTSAFDALKAEVKAEVSALKAEVSALKAEVLELKGGKGGRERRKPYSFKNAHDPLIDPSSDPEDTRKRARKASTPPSIEIPEEVNTLITALASISKTPHWIKSECEFEDAAWLLHGYEVTPDQVFEFGKLWEKHGRYSGKPALKSIVTNFPSWLSGHWPEKQQHAAQNGKPINNTMARLQARLESARAAAA